MNRSVIKLQENLSEMEDMVNARCINNRETAFVKRAGGNRSQTGLTSFRCWPTDIESG
ncbi:MAG: hypothetical protein F6K40_32955 [Okeania sp. SIO3I5]|uniref:hypothetical protein n=1 Tax=Okeania sp. SIO3I5 TaxID=2607805 RepID=UPI0013B8E0B6|nr:hypothetical protein [Okeania sp. SIO3I5]NEQ40773.1 hypothetical protein [Okeania sp. SIO3I5]